MGVWGFLLQRHTLLYSKAHAALFFGPGFTEMRLILPLIWLSAALLAATGGLPPLLAAHPPGLEGPGVLCGACSSWRPGPGIRDFLPDLVQRYIVKPNEISREKPFIANSVQATLAAYDLDRVETREYRLDETPGDLAGPQVRANLRNIPVWDKEVLLTVYEQLQELRTYYNFTAVDVDRYTVNRVYQQVFLAARELNLKELPQVAQNWVNERLKYTHGYGVVMTPAAQGGEEPMTWFIEGIPPQSDYGFKIEQPAIYYGVGHYGAGHRAQRQPGAGLSHRGRPHPDGLPGPGRGPGQLPLPQAASLPFTSGKRTSFSPPRPTPKSRMLFRRNLVERIQAPDARFSGWIKDPYVVVTPQGLYWIQDAYTVSDRYPYAQPSEQGFNYIRNSVKIVVDAYHGSVDYYVADERDPIVRAYRRIYPGLLKGLEPDAGGAQGPRALPQGHLRRPDEHLRQVPPDGPGDLSTSRKTPGNSRRSSSTKSR